MRFKCAALVLLACGCSLDPEVPSVTLTTSMGTEIRLLGGREDLHIKGGEISVEWVGVEAPPGGSYELRIEGVETIAVFSQQGRFVLDRWVEFDLSSTWTHRYIIDVGNTPPYAVIDAPDLGALGEPVVLDASLSFDPDGDALQYQWRLFPQPSSLAVLSNLDAATTQFTPDLPGRYTVRLDVFDGLDWSATAEAVVRVR